MIKDSNLRPLVVGAKSAELLLSVLNDKFGEICQADWNVYELSGSETFKSPEEKIEMFARAKVAEAISRGERNRIIFGIHTTATTQVTGGEEFPLITQPSELKKFLRLISGHGFAYKMAVYCAVVDQEGQIISDHFEIVSSYLIVLRLSEDKIDGFVDMIFGDPSPSHDLDYRPMTSQRLSVLFNSSDLHIDKIQFRLGLCSAIEKAKNKSSLLVEG